MKTIKTNKLLKALNTTINEMERVLNINSLSPNDKLVIGFEKDLIQAITPTPLKDLTSKQLEELQNKVEIELKNRAIEMQYQLFTENLNNLGLNEHDIYNYMQDKSIEYVIKNQLTV